MNWKDVTSFSRSDTDRTPRAWEASAGGLRITVHRHRDFGPDVRLLSAAPFFDLRTLKSAHVDEAKAECQWFDAYMGILKVDVEGLRDGFLMTHEIDQMFPNLEVTEPYVKNA